eukprot:8198122-Karenia_brevis.AAC.1
MLSHHWQIRLSGTIDPDPQRLHVIHILGPIMTGLTELIGEQSPHCSGSRFVLTGTVRTAPTQRWPRRS